MFFVVVFVFVPSESRTTGTQLF